MKIDEPYLIISINDNKIIFFIISYNEKNDFKLIKNIYIDSQGIQNGRIADIDLVSQLIKKKLNSIEDELNYFFSKVSVIINPVNVSCVNISGYKKLNGSQVSKEDIAYILNDIKKTVTSNEDKHSLVHLFNYSFSLDSDNLENLPIGLFGEFYNQNMTFFLVNKNILKNVKLVFNNCGLNVGRIILKPFVEGITLLQKYKNHKNFIIITLKNKKINVSLFKNKSYVLTQDFNFGNELINKDVSKLCSLKAEETEFLLKEVNLKSVLEIDKDSHLDKKFFSLSPYRKIKHQLILDIITARLNEFVEICYEKNTNLNYFRQVNNFIYIVIENCPYFENFQYALQKNKLVNPDFIFGKNIEDNMLLSLNGAAELVGKGWEKEAIPVIKSKKSLISNFFSKLFS
jgi:cell division protein FtsA